MESSVKLVRYGLAVAAMMLAGCQVSGPPGDPLSRQFQWFRYIDGEDIRQSCTAGAPARYRLVFNADWQRQVRSYDVEPATDGGGMLDIRVFGPGLLNNSLDLRDIRGSVGGERAMVRLSADDVTRLDRALVASGLESAPPVGRRIWSDTFYWVVTACRDGRFWFNVFDEDQPGFAGLAFPPVLFALDRSGVPVQGPGGFRQRSVVAGDSIGDVPRFDIQVRQNGLGYARTR